MISAAVYARYSKGSHQSEQSIEGQLAAAEKYAAAHDMKIVAAYCDRFISGRSDDRAEFQRMLRDSSRKCWSVLITWKTDRIGRNREELAINKSKLKHNGVKICTVAEAIPDTPEGIILESVLEGFAEYFSAQLSANVRRGMIESAKKGQVVGPAPYGYIKAEDKRLVPDPVTAPVVRRIFSDYNSGIPLRQIASSLNADGLRSTRGSEFTVNILTNILKNRKYIGEYFFSGEVRGEVPALVSEAEFEKAGETMKKNRRAPSRAWTHDDYLLTGKLFCGHCESPMVGVCGTSRNGARHSYYECMGHRRKKCRKKTVRRDWIENQVIRQILGILADDDLLHRIADAAYALYASEKDSSYEDSLRASLAETEASLKNLLKALESGVLSPGVIDRVNSLEVQKADLESAIASAHLEAGIQLTPDIIYYSLSRMRSYDPDDPALRSKLIDTFVNAIYLYDDKLVIGFNYTSEGSPARVTLSDIADSSCSPLSSSGVPNSEDTNIFVLSSIFLTEKILC